MARARLRAGMALIAVRKHGAASKRREAVPVEWAVFTEQIGRILVDDDRHDERGPRRRRRLRPEQAKPAGSAE